MAMPECAVALTTEAVRDLSASLSPGKNREAVLKWIRQQGTVNGIKDFEQPEEDINESDDEDSLDFNSQYDVLSETETTVSACSLENEIIEEAFKALESCKEIVHRANKINKYFNAFIDKWKKKSKIT